MRQEDAVRHAKHYDGGECDVLREHHSHGERAAAAQKIYSTRGRRQRPQVTVYETVIELENVTSRQNVSVLVNETIFYNATYNISYDVSRNISYDVVYNQTYNITYNATVNVTEYVNVTKEVTTTYNVTNHQPVDVVLALDASRSVKDADFVAENRAGRELLRGLRDSLTGDLSFLVLALPLLAYLFLKSSTSPKNSASVSIQLGKDA